MRAVIIFQSVAQTVGVCDGLQSGHGLNSFQLFLVRRLVHQYSPQLLLIKYHKVSGWKYLILSLQERNNVILQ
jgi:hypothetical protein